MNSAVALIIGLFVGNIVGWFTLALCMTSKKNDKEQEDE